MTDAATGPEARDLADGLLRRAPVGFLAVHDASGPYVVPISFAYEGTAIYFHGGSGRKAAALDADPRACLSVTSDPVFIRGDGPCADNFAYESVVVAGTVQPLLEPAARDAALRALIVKYDPAAVEAAFDPATLAGTRVYRMQAETVGYKRYPK